MKALRITLIGSALLVLTGCGQAKHPDPESSSSAVVGPRVADELHQLWRAECPGDPEPERCGYLTDRMTPEWIHHVVTDACHENPAEDLSDDCRALISNKVLSALRRRYTWAKEAEVWAACRSSPGDCSNFVNIETLFMTSQNRMVWAVLRQRQRFDQEAREARVAAEDARQRAAEREADEQRAAGLQALGAILRGVGEGMQRSSAPNSGGSG